MITNGKKWHILAITSDHYGDYYCMNCLYSFRTENKLKSHQKSVQGSDYCHMVMPKKRKNILEYNQDRKSLKTLFVIYADTELLLEKIHSQDINPEKSSTAKISKHTACSYKLFTQCSFDDSKNKHDFERC